MVKQLLHREVPRRERSVGSKRLMHCSKLQVLHLPRRHAGTQENQLRCTAEVSGYAYTIVPTRWPGRRIAGGAKARRGRASWAE